MGTELVHPMERFADFLIKNAESISKQIVDFSLEKIQIEFPIEVIDQSVKTNRDFLVFIGKTLNTTDETVAGEFIEWYKKQTEQAEDNYNVQDLSTLIKPYVETRLHLNRMLMKISIEEGLSTEDVVYVNNRVSFLLDLSITETIIERERIANELNKKKQKVITELSTPVVPINDDLAILPLIGKFDLDKSQHIMDHVVPEVSKMNIRSLIIDLSGIATIDDEVASRIFQLNDLLRLLGLSAIFSGIRPELATKVVAHGIDFSSIETFATVQQAILSKV
ncbi:STAS domain-containing protein [Peribacillus sp. SCS-155]|uniref:STAS domain-containing protein n=1 Tax=Peribacillus sedimenti TaxID=3115297 RepID=UPI003905F52F